MPDLHEYAQEVKLMFLERMDEMGRCQDCLLREAAKLKIERDDYRFGNKVLLTMFLTTVGAWVVREVVGIWLR